MLKSSVIVPTYNRPDDLTNFIYSVLNQSLKPDELIIVDDGDLKNPPLKKEIISAGIKYIYHKKLTPGLTESRNAGIKLATGDIIFFFDDDVILEPIYIEETINTYLADQEEIIYGVGGTITNHRLLTPRDHLRKLFNIIFLISGLDEGKVLPSGFCTDFGSTMFPIKNNKSVDFVLGGATSYRKKLFNEFSFTDRYRSYGEGEDKDFSYPVSKKYKLIINPRAKLEHVKSIQMRPDTIKRERMFIMGRYMFFRDHVKTGLLSWLFFWYAISGYMFIRGLVIIGIPKKDNFLKLKGLFSIIIDIFKGNTLVHK